VGGGEGRRKRASAEGDRFVFSSPRKRARKRERSKTLREGKRVKIDARVSSRGLSVSINKRETG